MKCSRSLTGAHQCIKNAGRKDVSAWYALKEQTKKMKGGTWKPGVEQSDEWPYLKVCIG